MGNRASDYNEDDFLFMGTSETRGLIMMSPELREHISGELHKESGIMKERRKLREERRLANAEQDGTSSRSQYKGLQKNIAAQEAEIRRLKAGEPAAERSQIGTEVPVVAVGGAAVAEP